MEYSPNPTTTRRTICANHSDITLDKLIQNGRPHSQVNIGHSDNGATELPNLQEIYDGLEGQDITSKDLIQGVNHIGAILNNINHAHEKVISGEVDTSEVQWLRDYVQAVPHVVT